MALLPWVPSSELRPRGRPQKDVSQCQCGRPSHFPPRVRALCTETACAPAVHALACDHLAQHGQVPPAACGPPFQETAPSPGAAGVRPGDPRDCEWSPGGGVQRARRGAPELGLGCGTGGGSPRVPTCPETPSSVRSSARRGVTSCTASPLQPTRGCQVRLPCVAPLLHLPSPAPPACPASPGLWFAGARARSCGPR